MSYTVSATDLGDIRLNEREEVNAVLQNIALILATPKGSVPMYRDFGLSQEFLDRPMPVARVMMITEVREAIELWEPRATVTDIQFANDPLEPGKLIPTVEVEIHVEES
ncbi:MAG: GPW/gp25 family protein [Oscillospiraceae bacterium]|nr:GPW/gp25 family protein [Oscillospiraceae bacterium]